MAGTFTLLLAPPPCCSIHLLAPRSAPNFCAAAGYPSPCRSIPLLAPRSAPTFCAFAGAYTLLLAAPLLDLPLPLLASGFVHKEGGTEEEEEQEEENDRTQVCGDCVCGHECRQRGGDATSCAHARAVCAWVWVKVCGYACGCGFVHAHVSPRMHVCSWPC